MIHQKHIYEKLKIIINSFIRKKKIKNSLILRNVELWCYIPYLWNMGFGYSALLYGLTEKTLTVEPPRP